MSPTNSEIASDYHLYVTYAAPNSEMTEEEFEKTTVEWFEETVKRLHEQHCTEFCNCGE